ncbi:MAG: leucine--tRNA ligase [archaeon]|nr:leucine--tRNA ligase [archaeon]
MTIDWNRIQDKWQNVWEKEELGKAIFHKDKPKFYMIFAYPGPSGFLHVGHMRGYSYTDAICRYERLLGKEVLFPVGMHASGLPAVAFSAKVVKKDPTMIDYLKRNGCSEEDITKLSKPEGVVSFFNDVYVNQYWKKFGFLCDWDRFTCTTNPDYQKFIHWQFKKLQQRNLLIQKPYFATSCIKCGPVAVDPSETDISKGGNAEKVEYTLLKFKFNDVYLVAATLRPETIYGQTNLWINPDGEYVKVQVENEDWIISKDAADKLQYQKDDVLLKEDIDPKKLLGEKAEAPGINRKIIILPASFVDPSIGTGIVTSVPSDAPKDYVALRHLQTNPKECSKYGIDSEIVQAIKPIAIIHSKGFGEFPAKEIVEKMNIKSMDDPKLEEVTKEIYKTGHHTGVMMENAGKYSGKKTEEAKELMKAELIENKLADVFHDLSEEVLCRCGEKVIITRIDDQWFIRYSDPELTERSKEQVKEMKIHPQEYHDNLPSILDWFGDRACVRLGNWLGSKFPFDDRWIVEPISDSTLYPVYYIVSKFIHNKTVSVEDLSEEFFDYVFLNEGKGKPEWEQIREEFNYFYPLDMNLGGKEHKTVHFPVFIMNHVAILPEEKWPRGIFVNWWVTGKGGKISKSKGGAEPIPNAIERYGVDAMRLYYCHIGNPHTDIIWEEHVVLNYKNALERINSLIEEARTKDGKSRSIDCWLLTRLQHHLTEIDNSMNTYNLRELSSSVYYSMYDDLRWYLRRGGNHKKTINEFVNTWCVLMNPVTPHLSEELNNEDHLISSSNWPELEKNKHSRTAEAGEELVRTALEGMRNVIKLANIEKPKKFTLFVAQDWLYNLFTILGHEINVTRNLGEILRKVLEDEILKEKGKEVSKIVQGVLKDVSKLPSMVTSQEDELNIINDAKEFLEKEFECSVEIILAENSDHPKANAAMPGKVGILVE